MKRRQFIQTGSIVSLPLMLGSFEVAALSKSSLFNLVNPDDDKILVLVQLNGGNDGLNMIIPIDQYDGLNAVRANLMLPEQSVLKLTADTGIHPSMTGLHQLYQDGKMAVVQSVGYPNQNRSHFRSTDIWTSGSDSNKFVNSGWLGRYFADQYPSYPENYPNADYPDPFAISISGVVSQTCEGYGANFSYTLVSENNIKLIEETVVRPDEESCYSNELNFVRTSIKQSNEYANTVLNAFDKGSNIATYPADNRLANQLKIIANLISGGLKTRVYVVNLGGFDTHSNQVQIGEPTVGNHANLLQILSDAIKIFMDDCTSLGINERVVGMTFSEFGRQIRSNASFGTDHGTAAPLIVFGDCVKQGVFGANPKIDSNITAQEGVPMQYDFRSVYASILIDWMGADEDAIRNVLFSDFQRIPFLKNCSAPSATTDSDQAFYASLSPNPCSSNTYLNFVNHGRYVHVSLFNALGYQLTVAVNKTLSHGAHEIAFDLSPYPSGSYYVRIAIDNQVQTIKVVKV